MLVENEYTQKKLFFVVETKGVDFKQELPLDQQLKITCGEEHFKALETDIPYEMTKSFKKFSNNF